VKKKRDKIARLVLLILVFSLQKLDRFGWKWFALPTCCCTSNSFLLGIAGCVTTSNYSSSRTGLSVLVLSTTSYYSSIRTGLSVLVLSTTSYYSSIRTALSVLVCLLLSYYSSSRIETCHHSDTIAVDNENHGASLQLALPVHHEGWMISGQETVFCWVPVP
jgi:hypothetical protein